MIWYNIMMMRMMMMIMMIIMIMLGVAGFTYAGFTYHLFYLLPVGKTVGLSSSSSSIIFLFSKLSLYFKEFTIIAKV